MIRLTAPTAAAFPFHELKTFVGWRFQTLDQGNAFYLTRVEEWGVYYERPTGTGGFTPSQAFHAAWRRMRSGAELELHDLETIVRALKPDRRAMHESCLAPLLAAVEPVRYLNRPIRIFFAELSPEPGMTYRPSRG
jgi:hypothetical protein